MAKEKVIQTAPWGRKQRIIKIAVMVIIVLLLDFYPSFKGGGENSANISSNSFCYPCGEDGVTAVKMQDQEAIIVETSSETANELQEGGGTAKHNQPTATAETNTFECNGIDLDYVIQDVFFVDNHAYVANGLNGLGIYDVSNPKKLKKIGHFKKNRGEILDEGCTMSVFVKGTHAFVADRVDGFQVVDISNPSNITEIGYHGNFYYEEGPYDIFVEGNSAYLLYGFNGMIIFNISNPAMPTKIGQFKEEEFSPRRVFVEGCYAYLVSRANGLKIINVSNPVTPTKISEVPEGDETRNIFVEGSYAYVVNCLNRGLGIIDISDPSNPIEKGRCFEGVTLTGAFVSDNIAYLITLSTGLEIVDVSDPTNPQELGQYREGSARTVFVSNDYAFLVNYRSEFCYLILDVRDPTNPRRVLPTRYLIWITLMITGMTTGGLIILATIIFSTIFLIKRLSVIGKKKTEK